MIEQGKFTYSPSEEAFKNKKTTENQGRKQTDAIMNQKGR